ncbi:heparan-alpha-glucosaminide N-acetyltransferase domain-containing protein [Flammeovirga kamogawensis]|uniref:DUF1624 domain-containing protein n=1 Tax=Flammeovirga kamogawensis TaxID=373891 RepID=A0ABX8H3F3_9BACT|nr:heparan-alpha-glucosaminide N-acetyltransferase domain-containing protein [Flammeovirga kamogawensis]MBB6463625.1 putative membrane protein [Flammeovirga kamogawensis]QWG09847.1 DUF1624 domain-containing protein [Flammeovirga kamogawensis]TRX65354.1 DUF1624 domain-containing protein [Flammeovirga kamogawensis]
MNSTRYTTLDVLRGSSVLFLIPLHCMMMYATAETWKNSILGELMLIAERGTPVFLIVMGFSFVFSKRQSAKAVLKRGFKILGVGYLLNTLKFVVPILTGILPANLIEAHGLAQSTSLSNMLHFFLLGDILQLAGVSLLIMGILTPLLHNKYAVLLFGLIIIGTAKLVSGFNVNVIGIDYLLDLLWSNKYNVYFPIFPWMSFILMGRFLGMLYKEHKASSKKYNQLVLFYALGIIGFGMLLCVIDYTYHFGDYYHLGPGGTLLLLGVNMLFLSIVPLFVKFIPQQINQLLLFTSKNVTSFYIIQWVIIDWGMGIFGFAQLNQFQILLIIPFYTLLTFIILKFKDNLWLASSERELKRSL